jgi:hypothetical protein
LHDFDGNVRPSLVVKLAICGSHVASFSRLLGDEHDATQGNSAHRRRLIHRSVQKVNSAKLDFRFTEFSEVASRGVYALCSGSEREERRESMQNFLDGLVRSTKTVMTRVELGGTLFLVAVIGVLLTSREEGGKSD